MSLAVPSTSAVNGAPLRIAVVAARYNEPLVDALLRRVLAGLRAAGVKERRVAVVRVPGSTRGPAAWRSAA